MDAADASFTYLERLLGAAWDVDELEAKRTLRRFGSLGVLRACLRAVPASIMEQREAGDLERWWKLVRENVIM